MIWVNYLISLLFQNFTPFVFSHAVIICYHGVIFLVDHLTSDHYDKKKTAVLVTITFNNFQ